MLEKLKIFYKKHSVLYTVLLAVLFVAVVLYVQLPHSSFLFLFTGFCAVCLIIHTVLFDLGKSKKRWLKNIALIVRVVAYVMVAMFLVSFVIIQATIHSHIQTTDTECEYILVLGCGLRGQDLTLTGKARAEAAIDYLNKNPECTAFVCGGQGDNEIISEAEGLYRYMVSRGIDKERIIKEERSTDTKQNIIFAKELAIKNGFELDDNTAVVSNDFHLYRAKLIMRKAGFVNVFSINAPTPNIFLMDTSLFLREYFSVVLEYLNI